MIPWWLISIVFFTIAAIIMITGGVATAVAIGLAAAGFAVGTIVIVLNCAIACRGF